MSVYSLRVLSRACGSYVRMRVCTDVRFLMRVIAYVCSCYCACAYGQMIYVVGAAFAVRVLVQRVSALRERFASTGRFVGRRAAAAAEEAHIVRPASSRALTHAQARNNKKSVEMAMGVSSCTPPVVASAVGAEEATGAEPALVSVSAAGTGAAFA